MSAYEVGVLNKVRKGIRANYDQDAVFAVLDEGVYADVGFVDHSRPIVIPMIYGRIDDTVYLHGAKATRIAKLLGAGAPACVTVTLVDGLVVGRSAFHSSMNYRSVVLHGLAELVADQEERERALAAITDHLLPGRWAEARPTTRKEFNATGVIRFTIEAAAAKTRSGPPIDDEEDYDLPYWGGVVPVSTILHPARDDGRLQAGVQVPESVKTVIARSAPTSIAAE